MLKVLPELGQKFDLVLADPPYGVTDYEWDKLETFSPRAQGCDDLEHVAGLSRDTTRDSG